MFWRRFGCKRKVKPTDFEKNPQPTKKVANRIRLEDGWFEAPEICGYSALHYWLRKPLEADGSPRSLEKVVKGIDEGTPLLGLRAPACPREVHLAMEAMCARAEIPATTLDQRLKNLPCRDTMYSVPKDFVDALRGGYISINLPPPLGMRWMSVAGAWRLRRLGG